MHFTQISEILATSEMMINMDKISNMFLLGYGLISLATLDDLAMRFTLQTQIYNTTPFTITNVNQLWAFIQEDHHQSQVHAIHIANSANYIIHSTFHQDPQNAQAILENGQHCQYTISDCLCPKDLATLADAHEQLKRAKETGDGEGGLRN